MVGGRSTEPEVEPAAAMTMHNSFELDVLPVVNVRVVMVMVRRVGMMVMVMVTAMVMVRRVGVMVRAKKMLRGR